MTRLYFAYGSNLNTRDRQAWMLETGFPQDCLVPVSKGLLADHRLCFGYYSPSRRGGALDLRPLRGSLVHGVLFEADQVGWRALDRKEGVAGGFYERITLHISDPEGKLHEAVTYRACAGRRQDFVDPACGYEELVREGCREHGIPDEPVGHAARRARPQGVDFLFVYGTLMRGGGNHHALDEPESCAPARIRGSLYDLGWFPGMKTAPGKGSWVVGELARLRDVAGTLERTDRLEGYLGPGHQDNLYRRDLVQVDTGDGAPAQAWTYLYEGNLEERRRIASGNWREHSGAR